MRQRQTFLLGFVLVITTLVLYWPATGFPFVQMDDDEYVYENPWVTKGIGLASLKWAFSSTDAANWHPLTWISHLLDFSMYGLFAGGHHLTSLLLHALNTLLIFLLLKGLTKSLWPSFVVAGLFGWHPLHVESVAWVAERKDVLSTLFFLLTLWAYSRYAQRVPRSPEAVSPSQFSDLKLDSGDQGRMGEPLLEPAIKNQDSKIKNAPALNYLLALLFFAFGLMCKPMLVTVPFVLLLLDYWPLRRLSLLSLHNCLTRSRRLVWEKLPFFALSLGASVVTLLAQHAGGAMKSVEEVPVLLRAFNAPAAVVGYLLHALCPMGLCVLYPLPKMPPFGMGSASALVLAIITWIICVKRSDCPWAVTGWFWFLGTLVPVLGLVQVGAQAMADRYTYIPSIGLFLVMVWTAAGLLERAHSTPRVVVVLALVPVMVCLGLTRTQLTYWRDSVALFTRARSVTRQNAFAENGLGVALAKQGNSAAAIEHYLEAVRIKPNFAPFHYNLGVELAAVGRSDEASFHFSQALKLNPQSEVLHNNLGVILAQQGTLEPAIRHFLTAIQLNPKYPKPYLNYAVALQRQGDAGAAISNYTKAVRLDAQWPDALQKLAFLLATCPDPKWRNPADAVKLAERACALSRRQVPAYLGTLATSYAAAGQFSNAVSTAELAREQGLRLNDQTLAQRLERDLRSYRAGQLPDVDWRNP